MFLFLDDVVVALISAAADTSLEKDEPVTFLNFTRDAYIMVATGTMHKFLELSFLRF